jgi:ankyrin repeat protein
MIRISVILLAASCLTGGFTHFAQAQDHQAQLWDASIAGDTIAITQALDAGAKVDSLDTRRNPNGRRALNWAAYNNRGPAVRILIARGASLNLTNNTGFTPVHHAAEAGALETLAILIEAGADITIPSNQGNLPLDTANARGHSQAAQLLTAASKKP